MAKVEYEPLGRGMVLEFKTPSKSVILLTGTKDKGLFVHKIGPHVPEGTFKVGDEVVIRRNMDGFPLSHDGRDFLAVLTYEDIICKINRSVIETAPDTNEEGLIVAK